VFNNRKLVIKGANIR